MAAETTDLHFLGSRDRLNMPGGGITEQSIKQIRKQKKGGFGDSRRPGTGKDFIGTSTRFYRGRGLAAEATDLLFLSSKARLNMPGG